MANTKSPNKMYVTGSNEDAAAPSLPSAEELAEKWHPSWKGVIHKAQALQITKEILAALSSDKVSKEDE